VLVTGAGGPAGVAVIQELLRLGSIPVAGDCDPTAVGFHLAPEACTLRRADDPEFVPTLVDAAQRLGCTAVVATVAEELVVLSRAGSDLAEAGLGAWIPSTASIETCVDKWAFAISLRNARIPAPPTALGKAGLVEGPWIVKPRFGRGAQNVFSTADPDDLPALLRLVPEPVVQSRLSGEEFSADCLVDDEGRVRCVVARWRTETRGGIATKGTTFCDPRIDDVVARVATATGITGTFNLQGFRDGDGSISVVEVNPRFSGSLPLSLAAGGDLVGQHVRRALGLEIEQERLAPRPGVSIARYFADVIIG
jgi:carbamoyl-phosphate synthase large subunit